MAVRTVTRRGQRRLVIDFSYRKPDGSKGRYRHDAEVQTLAAARAEERRRLAALASTGSPFEVIDPIAREQVVPAPAATGPTFAEVVEKYEAAYLPTLKTSTQYGYKLVIKTRLLPRFRELPLEQIDARAVREFEAALAKDGMKKATRRSVLIVLRSILCRFAVEAKHLAKVPEMPSLPKRSKTAVLALSRPQVDALLEASSCIEQKLAFALAAFAGLRAGEVRALRWGDVDLTRGEIVVRFAKSYGVTDKPKSGDDRVIPIARELRVLLEARGERPRDELISTTREGQPWGQHGLRDVFNRVAPRAKIEGFHYHCLRHFFITELFDKGVGAPTVQELAGHESLETTARYAHTRKGSARDAIERLSGGAPMQAEKKDEPIAAE